MQVPTLASLMPSYPTLISQTPPLLPAVSVGLMFLDLLVQPWQVAFCMPLCALPFVLLTAVCFRPLRTLSPT
jgi:hypothetical protein